jgi:hypothetical protein
MFDWMNKNAHILEGGFSFRRKGCEWTLRLKEVAKFLVLIFILTSGIEKYKTEKPPLCLRCKQNSIDSYSSEELSRLVQNDSLKFLEPLDSLMTYLVVSHTDSYTGPGYYYSYDRGRDLYGIILEQDYAMKLYLIGIEKEQIRICVLAAAFGGDGGDGYEMSSELRHDTLYTREIVSTVYVDIVTDTFSDSMKAEIFNKTYLILANHVELIHAVSTSFTRY